MPTNLAVSLNYFCFYHFSGIKRVEFTLALINLKIAQIDHPPPQKKIPTAETLAMSRNYSYSIPA